MHVLCKSGAKNFCLEGQIMVLIYISHDKPLAYSRTHTHILFEENLSLGLCRKPMNQIDRP